MDFFSIIIAIVSIVVTKHFPVTAVALKYFLNHDAVALILTPVTASLFPFEAK